MRKILIGTLALLGAMALPAPAHAGAIQGQIDFSGGAVVSATAINWFLSVTPTQTGPQLASIVGSSITDGGATVLNLQPCNATTPCPPNLGQITETNLNLVANPPGQNLNVNLFESEPSGAFPATPIVDFVLNFVTPCSQLGAVTCLTPNSAFGLVQQPGFVAVTLVMNGVVFDTATPGVTSNWSGLWTANVPGTIAQLAAVISAGGTISNSFSGTKVAVIPTAIPEPATLLTFGFGSLALARYRRRKKA